MSLTFALSSGKKEGESVIKAIGTLKEWREKLREELYSF